MGTTGLINAWFASPAGWLLRLSLYSPNAGDCTADFSCGPSNVGNYWYNESDGRWYETPPRPDYGEWNWSNPAPDRKQRELNDYRQEVLERERDKRHAVAFRLPVAPVPKVAPPPADALPDP